MNFDLSTIIWFVLGLILIVGVALFALRATKVFTNLLWAVLGLGIPVLLIIDVVNGAPVLRAFAWLLLQLYQALYAGVQTSLGSTPQL